MNKILAKVGTAAMILGTPMIAMAQDFRAGDFQSGGGGLADLLKPLRLPVSPELDIATLAVLVLNFVILIAAILAIFYLIWAGINYITASSDDEKAKKARAGIYNAVIGIVVIILSYVIIQYVSSLTRGAVNQLNSGSGGGGGFQNRR